MTKISRVCTLALCLAWLVPGLARADSLDKLASDFWAWRAIEQPITSDDVPRIERPKDWAPDWSRQTITRRRKDLAILRIAGKLFPWPVSRWRGKLMTG